MMAASVDDEQVSLQLIHCFRELYLADYYCIRQRQSSPKSSRKPK